MLILMLFLLSPFIAAAHTHTHRERNLPSCCCAVNLRCTRSWLCGKHFDYSAAEEAEVMYETALCRAGGFPPASSER